MSSYSEILSVWIKPGFGWPNAPAANSSDTNNDGLSFGDILIVEAPSK
jgi:hypothetical protein